MVKQFLLIPLMIVLVVGLVFSGCAAPAPAPTPVTPVPGPEPTPIPTPAAPAPAPEKPTPEKWPDAISFATGPSGSGAYARTAGLAVLINKYLGITCAPESLGVPHAQLMAMRAGKAELAWPFIRDARGAYFGAGAWTEEPLDIRVVIGGAGSTITVCTDAKSGLVNFEDIRGKRVICEPPAPDWWAVAFDFLLEAHGMTKADITPMKWTGHGTMIATIDAGGADVGVAGISPVNLSPAYLEQDIRKPLRVLHIDEDKLEYVIEKMGPEVSLLSYPGGLWKMHPEGYQTLVTYMGIVAPADLPETFIYSFSKMCFEEHHDEYLAVGRGIEVYNVEDTIEAGATVPLHAGVIKYLKEKGLWNTELEARQEKLLKEFGSARE